MKNRVLNAADILVNRQPRIDRFAVGRSRFNPRIGESRKIPRRVDERVHRVGFALGGRAALRAVDMLPGRMVVEWIARLVERDVFWERYRQVLFGYRDNAAVVAMNDWDWTAPITLPRNTPITQAKIDLTLGYGTVAPAFFLQSPRNFLLGLRDCHAVQEPRVDHAAIAIISDVGDDEAFRILTRRADHWGVAESVFVYEIEVALIMRRAAKDGARAVLHQNEIRHIDRQPPVRIKWMNCTNTGINTFLFSGFDQFLRGAPAHTLGDEFGHLFIFRRGRKGKCMIRRDRHKFRAKQSVRSRREDFQFALNAR